MENLIDGLSPKGLVRTFRKKVSQDRHRFQDYKHDLDLSYITDNVIAMGFPSSGIESLWRNSVNEVCDFMKEYHQNDFMIWNLSGRKYDYDKFNNQILDFGFPDHHSPPLELLFKIVLSISSYLQANPDNVAVAHCMGGKGRTGTVIACYLVYSGEFNDADSALNFFAVRRSSIAKGVIQASQIRYTQYFADIINNVKPKFRNILTLTRIQMNPPPAWSKGKGCRPVIEVYSTHHYPKKLLYTTLEHPTNSLWYNKGDGPISWEMNCVVQSDVLIAFSKYKGAKKKAKKMFRYSFHCGFVKPGTTTLKMKDFDDIKKFGKWFDDPNAFEVRLTFAEPPSKLAKIESPDLKYDDEIAEYFNEINEVPENLSKEELEAIKIRRRRTEMPFSKKRQR